MSEGTDCGVAGVGNRLTECLTRCGRSRIATVLP